jgi:hypothetical protein
MLRFNEFEPYYGPLTEEVTSETKALKSYVNNALKTQGIKTVGSGRGDYHIRFAIKGDGKAFSSFFMGLGLSVKDASIVVSEKYPTYTLTAKKDIADNIPKGSTLYWVNSEISQTSSGGQIFANKALTPDALGLAGRQLNSKDLIAQTSTAIKAKYPDGDIAAQLIELLKLANTKESKISLKDINFEKKDLAKISADFGEILSAIWIMKKMNFREAFFPSASNEKLIDFYGVRVKTHYPISVKSGGGGKVTIKNIVDAIKNRAKTANADHSKEKALIVFNIVSEKTAKEQMLALHQYLKTNVVKDLSKIMNISVDQITLESIKLWTNKYDNEELVSKLAPWHKKYSMPGKKTLEGRDKARFILSPLGETIYKILNNDKEMQRSLTNVARQVTLIQLNVNVHSNKMTFESNYFKEAEFTFGWPGYSSGNKLGFKMKMKR